MVRAGAPITARTCDGVIPSSTPRRRSFSDCAEGRVDWHATPAQIVSETTTVPKGVIRTAMGTDECVYRELSFVEWQVPR